MQTSWVNGEVELRPVICLSEYEKDFGRYFSNQIAIVSSVVQAYKSWSSGRLQQVIDSFPSNHFVQLGVPSDSFHAMMFSLIFKNLSEFLSQINILQID
jgi:hypothetical protein